MKHKTHANAELEALKALKKAIKKLIKQFGGK